MSQSTDSHETLVTLTSDIVAAHVSYNDVGVDEVSGLITSVYAALAGLGENAAAEGEKPLEPAVSLRSSVKPDSIACLECGRRMKLLKRHLQTDHGLTVNEYRQRWGLNNDYPVVAPEYAARRRNLAIERGLGKSPLAGRGRGGRKKLGIR